MNDRAAGTAVYSIDTSALMDWMGRYYPRGVFPGIVTRMEDLARQGRLLAPQLVREEVAAVGTPELDDWCEAQFGIFVPTGELLTEAVGIQGRFPGLLDPRSQYEEADAYVIALAVVRGGIVVTQETPAAEKNRPKRSHYIPDVCRDLGVPCINLLGLMTREGWRF